MPSLCISILCRNVEFVENGLLHRVETTGLCSVSEE